MDGVGIGAARDYIFGELAAGNFCYFSGVAVSGRASGRPPGAVLVRRRRGHLILKRRRRRCRADGPHWGPPAFYLCRLVLARPARVSSLARSPGRYLGKIRYAASTMQNTGVVVFYLGHHCPCVRSM